MAVLPPHPLVQALSTCNWRPRRQRDMPHSDSHTHSHRCSTSRPTSAAVSANQSRSSGLLEAHDASGAGFQNFHGHLSRPWLSRAMASRRLFPRARLRAPRTSRHDTIGATLHRLPVCRRHHVSRRPRRAAPSPSSRRIEPPGHGEVFLNCLAGHGLLCGYASAALRYRGGGWDRRGEEEEEGFEASTMLLSPDCRGHGAVVL